MRAAATLCDWLSGRRRSGCSSAVRDELAGSANSECNDGAGWPGPRNQSVSDLAVFGPPVQSGASHGRSVPKRMSTVAVTSY